MNKLERKDLLTRRKAVLKEVENNSIILIYGSKNIIKTNDIEYDFRQDSDFLYLIGIKESNLVSLILKKDNKSKVILFRDESSEFEKQWIGTKKSNSLIKKDYAIDSVYPLSKMHEVCCKIKGKYKNLYFSRFSRTLKNRTLERVLHSSCSNKSKNDISKIINNKRLIKTPYEIKQMQKAADISVQAHQRVMEKLRHRKYEYQIHAELNYVFNKNNTQEAYPSIVASGENACILHYIDNKSDLKKNDLLLIDAAAEYNHYASDITRTYPISGKFSRNQALLYNTVLTSQLATIKEIKPGMTWEDVHQITIREITIGLIKLGILKKSIEYSIKNGLYKRYFMHGTGHWLGLDVHDAGSVEENNKPRKLMPGMVTTVEPGIYIRPNKPEIEFKLLERDPKEIRERRKLLGMEKATKLENEEIKDAKSIKHKIPKDLLGIGIRIEDDIVCTDDEPINLTEEAPKSIEDVEAICS